LGSRKFWQFALPFTPRLELIAAWVQAWLAVLLLGQGFELVAFRSPLAI